MAKLILNDIDNLSKLNDGALEYLDSVAEYKG